MSSPGPRVLIVDDNPTIRRALRRLLRRDYPGAEVVEASDGLEVGAALAGPPPALVVLDLLLPRLNGFKVCELIRSTPALAGVKIVCVSGYGSEELRARALKSGADDFLHKPLEAEETRRLLARYLA